MSARGEVMDGAEKTAAGVPDAAEVIRRARELVPKLAARAAAAERERCIPRETIAEMQRAGLFRVLQPKRWDGYEMEAGVYFDVLMTLAEGCMSTAWVYGVVGVHPWFMALFDDRAPQEVWGKDRSTLICSSLAPTGKAVPAEGGYRLGGRWQYSSGCDHCDWALLGAVLPSHQPGPPDRRIFLVPRRDYEIIDTWFVAGLKATGSKDIVVADAFVPEYRVRSLVDNFNCVGPGQALNTAALYRLPMGQVFFHGVSTGAIGALQGMLDAFLAFGGARVSLQGHKTAEDPVAQLACAEAAATVDELKLVLHRNLRNLGRYAERGEVPPFAERQQYKFQSAFAVERCRELAARLFKLCGAGGIYATHPFGRVLADITTARQHISNQFETYGRSWGGSLLGLEYKSLDLNL